MMMEPLDPFFLHRRSTLDDYRVTKHTYTDQARPVQVLHHLNKLRQNGLFTDVTIQVKEEEFTCHKAVLAAACPYFKALFQHSEQARSNPVVQLQGVPPIGFACLLDFMYTTQVEITPDNAVDIFETADFLQFREITESVSLFLLQHISIQNCLRVMLLADAHSCEALCKAAMAYAAMNMDDVCKTKDFSQLSVSTLVGLLSHDQLMVTEEHSLFFGILAWICENEKSHQSNVDDILKFVCFDSIDEEVLLAGISGCPTLQQSALVEKFLKMKEQKSEVEHESLDDSSSSQTEGEGTEASDSVMGIGHRLTEILVIVPRETKVEEGNRRNRQLLYYCEHEQRWKHLTSYPSDNWNLFAVAVCHNRLYLTGGEDMESSRILDDAWSYDVNSETWAFLQPMLRARSNHSSASALGKVYVVGGKAMEIEHLWNDGEEFSCETGQWTLLPRLLHTEGVGRCGLVPLADRIYVLGGTESYTNPHTSEIGKRQYKEAQYYDTNARKWFMAPGLFHALEEHKMSIGSGDCLEHEGLMILIDEDFRGKKIKIYNPITEELSDLRRTHGFHRFGGYALFKNRLYCTGGVGYQFRSHELVHYCDFQTGATWQNVAPLSFNSAYHACVKVFKRLV